MQINPLLTSQENLLALITANNTSGTPFDAANVWFGGTASFTANLSPTQTKLITNPGTGVIVFTAEPGVDSASLWEAGTVTIDETNPAAKTIVFQLEADTEAAALLFEKWFTRHTSIAFGGVTLDQLSNKSVNYIGMNGSSRYEVHGQVEFVYESALALNTEFENGLFRPILISGNPINSRVTVSATGNAGFSGSREIYYSRLRARMATTFDVVNGYIDVPDAATTTQVLEAISAQAGLVYDAMASNATVSFPIQPTATSSGTCRIQFATANPLYSPQPVNAIVFNIRYPQQSMEDAVVFVEMDGFDTPGA